MKKQPAYLQNLLLRISETDDMYAYEKLYYTFYTSLYHFAFSIIRSKQEAEEIVSDVFIKVWQARSALSEVSNISVYLYTGVRNRAIDYLNAQRRHAIVYFSEEDWGDTLIELKNPSDYCISTDLMKKINAAVNQLPPRCKVIFRLVREEGLTYKQVAAIMRLSPLTVRNQLAIAVRKIGEMLPEYIYEGPGGTR